MPNLVFCDSVVVLSAPDRRLKAASNTKLLVSNAIYEAGLAGLIKYGLLNAVAAPPIAIFIWLLTPYKLPIPKSEYGEEILTCAVVMKAGKSNTAARVSL